jgi:hypothetical protein
VQLHTLLQAVLQPQEGPGVTHPLLASYELIMHARDVGIKASTLVAHLPQALLHVSATYTAGMCVEIIGECGATRRPFAILDGMHYTE